MAKRMMDDAMKAKLSLSLWFAIYFVLLMAVVAAKTQQASEVAVSGDNAFGIIELLSLIATCAILLPLSFVVRYYSKKAGLCFLKVVATFLTVLLSFWCAVMLIACCLYL